MDRTLTEIDAKLGVAIRDGHEQTESLKLALARRDGADGVWKWLLGHFGGWLVLLGAAGAAAWTWLTGHNP